MWWLMEAVSGHTGITVSYILPNLRKNTIRIIMTKTISESKCDLSNYNHIHIHIFMVVSMVTEFYQMKEKVICYITVYGCYGLFYNLEFLQFFNQNCSIFAEETDGERVKDCNWSKQFLINHISVPCNYFNLNLLLRVSISESAVVLSI